MIDGLFSSGSIEALERVVQFTSKRHGYIVDNIANLTTPNYVPRDMPVKDFHAAMRDALDRKREAGPRAPLVMNDGNGLRFTKGGIESDGVARNDNVLFHDGNNRSVEHVMKDLVENTMTHNAAVRLIKSEFTLLESAIKGTP